MAPGLLVIMKLKEMSKQGAKYGYYGLSITRVCPEYLETFLRSIVHFFD